MREKVLLLLLISGALLTGALTTKAREGQQEASAKKYERTGTEATITGLIFFEGEVPKPKYIDMGADEECVKSHQHPILDDVVVNDSKLANVLIYVKSAALDKYAFEPPSSPAVLERTGCILTPHVLGIQTRQILQVLNNSRTTHNTHPTPKNNPEWSQTQIPGAEQMEKTFLRPEQVIPIKDNQHPWEKAYIGVFSHPFFAVTGQDSFYSIAGLPTGDYTLVAWHEKFGEQTREIHVSANEVKTVNFVFSAQKEQ